MPGGAEIAIFFDCPFVLGLLSSFPLEFRNYISVRKVIKTTLMWLLGQEKNSVISLANSVQYAIVTESDPRRGKIFL